MFSRVPITKSVFLKAAKCLFLVKINGFIVICFVYFDLNRKLLPRWKKNRNFVVSELVNTCDKFVIGPDLKPRISVLLYESATEILTSISHIAVVIGWNIFGISDFRRNLHFSHFFFFFKPKRLDLMLD